MSLAVVVVAIQDDSRPGATSKFISTCTIRAAVESIRDKYNLSGGVIELNGVSLAADQTFAQGMDALATIRSSDQQTFQFTFVNGRPHHEPTISGSIEEQIHNLSLVQHQILNQLPASVVHIKLTPSLATVVKDDRFRRLMDALNLGFPKFQEGISEEEGEFAGLNFEWAWGRKPESASYEPFCQALANLSIVAVCVSEGQRLMGRLLYITPLWSLRQFDEEKRKVGKVIFRGEISGRTDIVLMDDDPGSDILRHNVKVAIEVKRSKDIGTPSQLKSALREATTQLLGLCGDNSINTPPVLLTDFCSVFIVLQLRLKSNYPLKFEILAWRCSNNKSALHKAVTISMLPCMSANFGRPDTPSGSDGDLDEDIAGLKVASNEETEDGNEEYI